MTLLFTLLIISGIIIGIVAIKKLRFLQIVLSVFSGVSALLACDLIFSLFGQNIPLNAYTISISAIGGIPGVILLTILRTLII